MSQFPQQNVPAAFARPPLSKASLTSFILSLVFCIPLLTSLLAILFAIAGFRGTRRGAARGRGFAITGLILGLLGILGWSTIGAFMMVIFSASSAPRATLHDFVKNLTDGNIPASVALCDPPITEPDLTTLHTQMATLGTYRDLTCFSANLNYNTGETRCILTGIIYFNGRTEPFDAVVHKDAAGNWKMIGFHMSGIAPP